MAFKIKRGRLFYKTNVGKIRTIRSIEQNVSTKMFRKR